MGNNAAQTLPGPYLYARSPFVYISTAKCYAAYIAHTNNLNTKQLDTNYEFAY